MENKIFTGIQCWHQERISQVINKEAVSVVRSNFLATHAPLHSIHYQRQPQNIADKSEQGLFDELLRCNLEDRHTFMVVQGMPGTGKSHLIRWLKERYFAFNQENQIDDVVILIERANCNLQGTLLQIIKSDIFAQTAMQEHLKKLQNATTQLSSNTLSDTILDQIRNATIDVELPEEKSPKAFIRKRVKWFLQDEYVRRALQASNGPVDRIKRYLINEQGSGIENHEIPGFIPQDFQFDLTLLTTMRDEGGYKEARELAERLYDEENSEYREDLAAYFNHLLNYAISRTTALTAEDLKQIFNDIRRELRQQHRNLALFIEDITAFTGIDEGLIDVLATQHTGEANREFCRLISVIGITNNYFQQHFPDNMRERITHRLTLDTDIFTSDLLTSSRATADLTARYLNAIRLPQETLDQWVSKGAHPEQLPNSCDGCKFRATCHHAFGFVELNPHSNEPQHVGLYPFNETALWTMYQQIDTRSISHTPRTLLTSILSYVLESHGTKIETNNFPPPAKELGSDFGPPPLQSITHRQMIQTQAGHDAARLESLILFWGTRSINTTITNGQRMVGGLSEDVFKAFNLPFIEGETTVDYSSSTEKITTISYSIPPQRTITSPPSPSQPTTNVPFPTVNTSPETKGRYTEDINSWLDGAQLQYFDKLGDLLVKLIETAIDWEAYGIAAFQVEDRVRRAKMFIEGKKGKITNINDCFIFQRSASLAIVLQALDDLNANYKQVSSDKLGGYLPYISAWLEEQEADIVDFVRRPTGQSLEKKDLPSILLANCLFLSCLQGNLAYKNYTHQELLFSILEDCTKPSKEQWSKSLDDSEKYHGKTWLSIIKGVNKNNYASTCRLALMQVLNCPQGTSKNVLFIDTDLALTLLEQLEKKKWQLAPIETVGSGASREWIAASDVYTTLEKYVVNALEEERSRIESFLDELQQLIGDDEPKATFDSIQTWVKKMEQLQLPHNLETKTTITASKLQRAKAALELIVKSQRLKESVLRLSEANQPIKEAQEHLQYLKAFFHEVTKQLNQQQQLLAQLQVETAQIYSPDQVNVMYGEVLALLTQTIQYGEEITA